MADFQAQAGAQAKALMRQGAKPSLALACQAFDLAVNRDMPEQPSNALLRFALVCLAKASPAPSPGAVALAYCCLVELEACGAGRVPACPLLAQPCPAPAGDLALAFVARVMAELPAC